MLTPDLSWRAHVAHVSSRLFHQSARGAVVKVCPSVSLSPCLTRTFSRGPVLDWSSWATMLQLLPSFNLALRRWCRQLLGWCRASPIAAIHWEVGIGNSLRLVLGRAFPLFGRLCAMDPCWLSISSARNHFQALCQRAGHLGPLVRFSFALAVSSSPLRVWNPCFVRHRWPSHSGALGKFVFAWIVTSITNWQPWKLTFLVSGWTLDLRLPVRDNTVPLPQLPVRLVSAMGTSSLGPRPLCRSARHQNSPVGCRLCHADDGSPHPTTSQRARATTPLETCGRSRVASLPARLPPGLPTLARQPSACGQHPADSEGSRPVRRASVQPAGIARMMNVLN